MLSRSPGRESLIALALGALLFAAALPAGSVQPAAQLALRLAALGLFASTLFGPRGRRFPFRLLPGAALAGVALLGLLQSCSWPAGVVAAISPEHLQLRRQAAALAGGEPGLSGPQAGPRAVPLSLDAYASRSAALSWLANAALLVVALVGGRKRRHRRWLLAALVGAAVVQIGLGLWRLETSSTGGLLAVALRPVGRLRGTYANPNHLSLLLEIALAAVAAWAWVELARLRRRATARGLLRGLLPPLIWLTLFAGVVLTGSRAGLAAALAGTAVQLAALPLAGRGRRAAPIAALALVLVLVALAGLGGREIRRYATVSIYESNLRSRLLVLEPSLELWKDFPLTGTGLGTFQDAFPLVAPAALGSELWNRAHNDPLELLVTGGLVGLGLGLVALAALLGPIWRRLRDGPELEDRAVGLAAVGALGAAGLHELLDFGLVIPANALALLVVLGAAAAAPDDPSAPLAPARE